MIEQSTNQPIYLTFSDDPSLLKEIRASLWQDETLLKEWTKDTMTFDGNIAELSFTQDETATYTSGDCILEVKWLNTDNITEFAKRIPMYVDNRNDKTIMSEVSE